jgi:predicted GNAT family acetyltransferase
MLFSFRVDTLDSIAWQTADAGNANGLLDGLHTWFYLSRRMLGHSLTRTSYLMRLVMSFTVHHDLSARRFEISINGAHCVLDYFLTEGVAANVMTITHTEVSAEVGGQGIASALMQAAMKAAKKYEWKVIPACSYADTWVKRHPRYRDLLA